MSARLTDRELEVAALLAEGFNWTEVAERLRISVSTVRAHVDRAHRKIGGRGRKSRVIVRHYVRNYLTSR